MSKIAKSGKKKLKSEDQKKYFRKVFFLFFVFEKDKKKERREREKKERKEREKENRKICLFLGS